jgi:hypothetical protein
MVRHFRPAAIDALIACGLACTIAAVGTLRHWTDLSAMRLPDADDMMRLQQIRDWLAGQAFADLTQYRLGASGVPMHWSRLDDLVPAAIMEMLRGTIGQHQAELVAVILWPTLLLAAAMALIGLIARAVAGPDAVRPALIVTAIAYPASTLFVPGRIDHHGLQLVLLLITTLMVLEPPSFSAGLTAGVAIALSLVVGMEMAPLLAAAAGVAIADWTAKGSGRERERLLGLGIALAGTTIAGGVVFRTWAWGYPACDGFTAISARAAELAALVPIGLAICGSKATRRMRILLTSLSGLGLAAALALSAPQCLSPYGEVDPLLKQLWLTRVGESQPLFEAPAAIALGYAALPLIGIGASAWFAWRTRRRGWIVLIVLQLTAAVLMVGQLRGANAGAVLAAPGLAAVILAARRSGVLPLIGAWIASAGMLYPMAAQAMVRPTRGSSGASCTAPDLIGALAQLPPGPVMAPIDTGAPAIASTGQRMIAGAYHRDGEGDLAMYAFFRGTPEAARAIAVQWNVRWVVGCDGFGGVRAPFAAQIERGVAPMWLHQVARVPSGARIFETATLPPRSHRPEQVNSL